MVGIAHGQNPEVSQIGGSTLNSRAAPDALDAVTLQLHTPVDGSFAGYYMALEQGYYEEAGLKVTIRKLGDGERAVTLAQEGKVEFFTSGTGLLLRRLRGLPVVNLAVTLPYTRMRVVMRRDLGFNSPADLRGKRLGLSLGMMDLVSRDFLFRGGLSENDVQWVYGLSAEEGYRALVIGEVDAYVTSYPERVKQLDGPENLLRVVRPRDWGADFIGGCFGALESQVEQHPQRVKAFREATMRGWYFAATNIQHTLNVMETKHGVTRFETGIVLGRFRMDVINSMERAGGGWNGDIAPERWEGMAESIAEMGAISGEARGNLTGFNYTPPPKEWSKELWWLMGVLMGGLAVALGHVGWRWLLHRGVVARTSVLMDSEAQYRQLFTHGSLPVVLLDAETWMPLEFNPAALELLECSASEMLRMRLVDLEPSPSERGSAGGLRGSLETGRKPFETRLRLKSGRVLDVQVWGKKIDWGGEPVYELVLVDQGDRNGASGTHEASAPHGQLLADGIGAASLLVDGAGVIVEASRAACARLGYDHGALIGQPFSAVDRTWESSERSALLKRFEGGQSVMGWSVFRCADGSEFEAHARVVAMGDRIEPYRVVIIGMGATSVSDRASGVELAPWSDRVSKDSGEDAWSSRRSRDGLQPKVDEHRLFDRLAREGSDRGGDEFDLAVGVFLQPLVDLLVEVIQRVDSQLGVEGFNACGALPGDGGFARRGRLGGCRGRVGGGGGVGVAGLDFNGGVVEGDGFEWVGHRRAPVLKKRLPSYATSGG
ncbi:MAG: ABC transporter substrate-binding protein [Planctomycetota bacterium]|jgi:PAS domain S-box-containing protein